MIAMRIVIVAQDCQHALTRQRSATSRGHTRGVASSTAWGEAEHHTRVRSTTLVSSGLDHPHSQNVDQGRWGTKLSHLRHKLFFRHKVVILAVDLAITRGSSSQRDGQVVDRRTDLGLDLSKLAFLWTGIQDLARRLVWEILFWHLYYTWYGMSRRHWNSTR